MRSVTKLQATNPRGITLESIKDPWENNMPYLGKKNGLGLSLDRAGELVIPVDAVLLVP